jgi:hypothetical protein
MSRLEKLYRREWECELSVNHLEYIQKPIAKVEVSGQIPMIKPDQNYCYLKVEGIYPFTSENSNFWIWVAFESTSARSLA